MASYKDMRIYSLEHGSMTDSVLQERARRYDSPGAIHLPFQIGDWSAFVMLNAELSSLISSIYRKNNALSKLVNSIPEKAVTQFTFSTMAEEIQQTNEVENVRSTRKEIHAAIDAEQQSKQPVRFSGMVRKYIMLINELNIPLDSCSDVRKLYDEFVLDEVLRENPDNMPDGVIFRKESTGVYDGHDKRIHSGLVPENKIIEVMEQGLSMLHQKEMDPLLRVALFHYLFAYIHPFYDGNGRMTRFISSYLLSQDFNKAACMRIAFVIKQHRKEYYRLFKDANDHRIMGELTSFFTGFLRFFEMALDDTYKSLSENSILYARYSKLLEQAINTMCGDLDRKYIVTLNLILIEELFGYQEFSIDALAYITSCNKHTIRKIFQRLDPLLYHTDSKPYHWHLNLSELEKSSAP